MTLSKTLELSTSVHCSVKSKWVIREQKQEAQSWPKVHFGQDLQRKTLGMNEIELETGILCISALQCQIQMGD